MPCRANLRNSCETFGSRGQGERAAPQLVARYCQRPLSLSGCTGQLKVPVTTLHTPIADDCTSGHTSLLARCAAVVPLARCHPIAPAAATRLRRGRRRHWEFVPTAVGGLGLRLLHAGAAQSTRLRYHCGGPVDLTLCGYADDAQMIDFGAGAVLPTLFRSHLRSSEAISARIAA